MTGTSTIDYIIIMVLLISFVVIGILVASSVFHFSLLAIGQTNPSLTGSPAQCNISAVNVSTPTKTDYFRVTVSEGSPGLNYSVYAEIPPLTGPVFAGAYFVGSSIFSQDFQLQPGNNIFIGNTTGSSVEIGGQTYKSGGFCESIVQIKS